MPTSVGFAKKAAETTHALKRAEAMKCSCEGLGRGAVGPIHRKRPNEDDRPTGMTTTGHFHHQFTLGIWDLVRR